MSSMQNSGASDVVMELVKIIQDNKDYLSSVDGQIGDGDHGINMNKGFTMSGEKIEAGNFNFSEALNVLGDTLVNEIGGSMGPIYGTLFMEMSDASDGKEHIDKSVFGDMLSGAVEGMKAIVDAREGDKTMMDVLLPAQAAFEKAVSEGKPFADALDATAKAANDGRDSTKDMVAKYGRASRLGERSRGVMDAGATSCALIIEGLVNGVKNRLK